MDTARLASAVHRNMRFDCTLTSGLESSRFYRGLFALSQTASADPLNWRYMPFQILLVGYFRRRSV